MIPLHAQATPNPNHLVPPPPVLSDPRAVFDHLLSMASLLRALDPTLPAHIRFFRRAEADPDQRHSVPFRLAFVKDPSNMGMGTPQDLDFWEVAQRVLPAHALSGERKALESAPSYKFANAIDAGVYGAKVDNVLQIKTTRTDDPDWVIQSSTSKLVPELDFMSTPSLARWVYLAPNSPVDTDGRLSPGLTQSRQRVRTLMDVLSRPFEKASHEELAQVASAFEALEKKRSSFEATHQHGWIGYALSHGSAGWTQHLLNLGASPFAPYNGQLPVVWATALDAASELKALEAAGASVSVLLGDAPLVYDDAHQAKVAARMGSFSTLAGFAAVVGATRSAAMLCKLGVDVNRSDNGGITPLHQAAASGSDPMCRVLVLQGANLSLEDNSGHLPSERVPVGSDALFDWLEAVRLGREVVVPEPEPAAAPAPFSWDDSALPTPARGRRGPKPR